MSLRDSEANPGARGPGPPLFLDPTEARRTEKKNFGDRPPPPYLRVWMTEPPPLSQGLDPALGFKVRPGSGDPEINIRIRGLGGKAEMTGMKNPIGAFHTPTRNLMQFLLNYSLVKFSFLSLITF